MKNRGVSCSDSHIFRYRYDFSTKLLIDFIQERYFVNKQEIDLEEFIADRVSLNGNIVDNSTLVNKGDWIEYLHLREDEEDLEINLTVLYEDDWIMAISKPDFLPVTPITNYYYNSLAILVKERFKNQNISPLHRLDIETSGVLLFGKTKTVRHQIQSLFQEQKVDKQYQAIVFNPPKVMTIAGNLVPAVDSKIFTKLRLEPSKEPNSLTLIEKQESWGKYFRLWIKPVTGKTNQIRAHLSAVGAPIVGDKKYFPDESVFLDWFVHRDINRVLPQLKLHRQALHCKSISFVNPLNKELLQITDNTSFWDEKIEPLQNSS